jgi:putative transposase
LNAVVLESKLPIKRACDALGLARSTCYRLQQPKTQRCTVRAASHRRLPEPLRDAIRAALHSQRFCDQTPMQMYHTLLSEGEYLASPRSIQRILKADGEQRERRPIRPAQSHAVPRLQATAPNQVWTWDITKLPLLERGQWLYLYVVIDLYSRYVVGWMLAETENSALAQRFIGGAVAHHNIAPNTLTVHQDRGAPMTSSGFISLLTELKIDVSHSRPRVSNDNGFSESQFKTMKTQPGYPKRFTDIHHARAWCGEFLDWYNDEHHHSGLNNHIPADVFYGRCAAVTAIKQRTLDAAYAKHPERFVNGAPAAKAPPVSVFINPLPASTVVLPSAPHANEITAPVGKNTTTRRQQARASKPKSLNHQQNTKLH